MKRLLKYLLGKLGYRVVNLRAEPPPPPQAPVEFSKEDSSIVEYVLRHKLTMVGRERLYATLLACKHVVSQGIAGDFVECGVWRGGNALIAAKLFARLGTGRRTYLFDTFAGMTEPSPEDIRARDGREAMIDYLAGQKEAHNEWCYASLEDVQRTFADAGLLSADIRFVQGDVAGSLRSEANLPKRIAVLRLDTDWYESTRVELEVLYPRLSPGGVLIIDDYGHWGGAKKAVDEYFKDHPRPLLQYTDYTGRMGVKPL